MRVAVGSSRRRDVKDGDDESLTREPEMVKAYRDTWEQATCGPRRCQDARFRREGVSASDVV
jgi:hypothetical protein